MKVEPDCATIGSSTKVSMVAVRACTFENQGCTELMAGSEQLAESSATG